MKTFLRRFLGVTLILIALTGMILGPVGIYSIWQVRTSVLVQFYETTQVAGATLSAASDGMAIVEQSLQTATDSLDTATQVTATMALTMQDINALAENFQRFLDTGIASFLLPNKDELRNTDEHLAAIQVELANMVTNMGEVNNTMHDALDSVNTYRLAIADIQEQILALQIAGPKWINAITWILTIGLAWIAMAQIGLVIQGIEFLRSPKERNPDASRSKNDVSQGR